MRDSAATHHNGPVSLDFTDMATPEVSIDSGRTNASTMLPIEVSNDAEGTSVTFYDVSDGWVTWTIKPGQSVGITLLGA